MKRLLVAALLALAPANSFAATLISTASGNINATGTWSVVDTTGTNAYLNSETANTALTTSPVASSTFTPASETVTAIGVKLASRAASPSGTITVKLANSTSPGSRECTQTVNVSDLVTASATITNGSGKEGGWIILTCSASPNGTDAYTITASTSVAAQVNLFSLATTNWSRLLVTSGTQANGPAAGDKFNVCGQLTGPGTSNAYTVTINTTALINYGNAANTAVDPSVAVCQGGTLAFGTSASTAYVFEFAGAAVAYNGATFNMGTSGARMPSTSSGVHTLNSTTEGDTGWDFRNGSTFNAAGDNSKSVVKTLLTTTANAAATSLTVADSTGWKNGDSIVVAPTATGGTGFDAVSLTADASGTTLTVGALSNQHTAGTVNYTGAQNGVAYAMNLYADVILLNRNVKIQGASTTQNGYMHFQQLANAIIDQGEFTLIGGCYAGAGCTPVAGERGLEFDSAQGATVSVTNSSFHDSHFSCVVLGGSNTTLFGGTAGNYVTFQHNVMYNCANTSTASLTNYGFGMPNASFNPYWKIDDLTIIRNATNRFDASSFYLGSQNGQVTNISVSGSGNGNTGSMVLATDYKATRGSALGGEVNNPWGPLKFYANVGYPLTFTGTYSVSGTIQGLYLWHETNRFDPQQNGKLTIDPFYYVTGGFGLYFPSNTGGTLTVRNGIIAWDNNASGQTFPVTIDAVTLSLYMDNMSICPQGTLGTGTVNFVACAGGSGNNQLISIMHDVLPGAGTMPSNARVFLRNTEVLNGITTKWPSQNGEEGFYNDAFIAHDCNGCSPVKHGAYVGGGYISYDTAITHSSGYSLRMTPKLNVVTGYIANTTLTTSTTFTANGVVGDWLQSNCGGFIPGTAITAGGGTSYTASHSQTACSSGSQGQFISALSYDGNPRRMQSAPRDFGTRIAVSSGVSNAQACVWLRPSINTDGNSPWGTVAVTYNGDNPRMIVRQNPYMGVQSDTVIGTSSPTAGAWSQFCATLPTAPADGQFEVVIDADQTFTSNAGGSVNITEWSCTNCQRVNGTQFWWNGVPGDGVAPNVPGRIIGGWMLERDLPANDNAPWWLKKVG